MAKAQKKMELNVDTVLDMPIEMPNEVTEEVGVAEEQTVEVDASGRKKKVDIAHEQLEELGLKNTSQIIRYLDSQNFSRSAIANFTGKRYQHVRNVLVTPLKKG